MKPHIALLIGVLAIMAAACGPQPAANGATVILTLPSADVSAGRQAFLDLKCTACHRVPSEPTFPPPVGATLGPPLDERMASQHLTYLATAIVSPSHRISGEISPELRAQIGGVLSPMGDFSGVMTVRQLADLHAYLLDIAAK